MDRNQIILEIKSINIIYWDVKRKYHHTIFGELLRWCQTKHTVSPKCTTVTFMSYFPRDSKQLTAERSAISNTLKYLKCRRKELQRKLNQFDR